MKKLICIILSLSLLFGTLFFNMPFETETAYAVGDNSDFKANMLSIGNSCTWAVTPTNELYFWGYSNTGNMSECKPFLHLAEEFGSSIKYVSAHPYSSVTFAVRSDGSLWGWGRNYDGALGDGTYEESRWGEPKWIMDGVKMISQSSGAVLAVKTDGSLWAWGGNWGGTVGDNSTEPVLKPKMIISGGVVSASAGGNHSMAIKSDNTLWAWGSNDDYQFGNGNTQDSLVPKQVMSGIKTVSADGCYTMAITTDNKLLGWGGNNYLGQIGDGTLNPCPSPKTIMSDAVSVATNGSGTFAVNKYGELYSWGDNSYGQLGNGTTAGNYTPKKVLSGVASVAAGNNHTAIIKTGGTVWVCGANDMYQLGDGTTVPSRSFKQVKNDESNLPVIVLPGIMGSTLKGCQLPEMPKELHARQADIEIFDGFIKTGANGLVKALKESGRTVYECPYDWRLSCDTIAWEYLKPVIDQAKKDTGKSKVIIVAHSMGGLVSRAYIQSAPYGNDVDALYMLGTPNMGSTAMIPLHEWGVPYDGKQAMVMKYNYDKMTGSDFNKASAKAIKSFVNKNIHSAKDLLPTYETNLYDTKTKSYFNGVHNSFLIYLNEYDVVYNRYQSISGIDKNKVRTVVFASNDVDTANAIKVEKGNGEYTLTYSDYWVDNRLAYAVRLDDKAVKTVDSIGDGTVLTRSATGSINKLDSVWTKMTGGFGEHMKLMDKLGGDVTKRLKKEDISILKAIMPLSQDFKEEPMPEFLQISITGADSSSISLDGTPLDAFAEHRYNTVDVQDGSYAITAFKNSDDPITMQIAYSDGNQIAQKTITFLEDHAVLNFNIINNSIAFGNEMVTRVRSVENDGHAKILWDAAPTATAYNIYAKPYNQSAYAFLTQTTNTYYNSSTQWISEFSEDSTEYYIVPVFASNMGGFDNCAYNFNTAKASFELTTQGTKPMTVNFTDTSDGEITSWAWDFDNDGIVDSTVQNPTFVYSKDGRYSITLAVSGAFGTDVKTYSDLILVGEYINKVDVSTKLPLMKVGSSQQLLVSAYDHDDNLLQTDQEEVFYSTTNEDVADIDENGLITAKAEGAALITVNVDGVIKSIEIAVKKNDVEIITEYDDFINANAKIYNLTQINTDINIYTAEYDTYGTLVSISAKPTTINGFDYVELPIQATQSSENYFKLFCWDNNLMPLSDYIEVVN